MADPEWLKAIDEEVFFYDAALPPLRDMLRLLAEALRSARHDLAVEWEPRDRKTYRAQAAAVADVDRALKTYETGVLPKGD